MRNLQSSNLYCLVIQARIKQRISTGYNMILVNTALERAIYLTFDIGFMKLGTILRSGVVEGYDPGGQNQL